MRNHLYKGKYLIALYDNHDECVGSFNNVGDAIKFYKLKDNNLYSRLNHALNKHESKLIINGKILTVRKVKYITDEEEEKMNIFEVQEELEELYKKYDAVVEERNKLKNENMGLKKKLNWMDRQLKILKHKVKVYTKTIKIEHLVESEGEKYATE